MAMSIRRFEHETPNNTHDTFEVTFFEDTVLPIVTKTPSIVDVWVTRIEHKYRRRPHSLVVGVDVEWRPNLIRSYENPVATLQLCVGRRCLIFQLLFSPTMPQSLKNFLRNPSYTFVGVGINNDVEKLMQNWNLEVANTADIGDLAAEEYGMRNLRNAGLKGLTRRVLGKELIKPQNVTMSDWDDERLTLAQVQYACIDAFLSYKIGSILISGNYN
ncbi:3'-5' exonuclease [Lactuca sativa]|uniref:3'-5' exonuclease n=1 Tax=Lactuca sativa TaxID=4236 RepID=UPI000CAF3DE3|nr:3'-5' exonuclease [Lactuca sativa]